MTTNAALIIRKNFPRPAAAQLAAFKGIPTGYCTDAQGRSGAIDHRIAPLTLNTAFHGVAVTVKTRPRDNLAVFAALEVCRPGDVIVVDCDDYEGASVIGDMFVGLAKNNGVVACITNGLARDIAGINEFGIPVFARGLSPNSPFKDGPGEIGLSIQLGGVRIDSGDIVVGDRDGVVVVPQAKISDVIAGLETVRAKEAKMEAVVRSGEKTPTWTLDSIREKGIRYID